MKIKNLLLRLIIKLIAFFISLFGKKINNEVFKDKFLVFYSSLSIKGILI